MKIRKFLVYTFTLALCLFIACKKSSVTTTAPTNTLSTTTIKVASDEFKATAIAAVNYSNCPTPVNCSLTLITTLQTYNVYNHNSSGYIIYKAKMSIDADGSPQAYGPNNSGLDWTANAGSTGNWWGVATDVSGNPYIQTASDPFPGMYVSTTSLVNSAFSVSNPLRYVDSGTIPYFVLPSSITSSNGITIGAIGFVYNTTNGKGCYAVFADGGPAGKLGEGSMFLATQLGINSSPKTGGTSSKIIDYIIFPGTGFGQGTIPTITQINTIGAAKMKKVGGIQIVNCL